MVQQRAAGTSVRSATPTAPGGTKASVAARSGAARSAAARRSRQAVRRTGEGDARRRLLDRVLAEVTAHGLGDPSLRALAGRVGSSHRMLIYHFGSRERLMVEIVRAVEARQLAILEAIVDELGDAGSLTEIGLRMWRHVSRPALRPNIRLFFELYGRALAGDPGCTPLLDGIVSSWVEPMAAWGTRRGLPKPLARAEARLGLAVYRGLLLDLVATEEPRAVSAAVHRWLELVESAPER